MNTLATLQAGESGVIRAIHSEQALYYRLAAMGFRIGKRIEVVRSARFSGPYDKVQLQVGRWLLWTAADESATLGKVGGEHAAATAPPFQDAVQGPPSAAERQPEEVFQVRRIDHLHHVNVVMQMLPHAGQMVDHVDAMLLQVRAGPDAAEHQQLG